MMQKFGPVLKTALIVVGVLVVIKMFKSMLPLSLQTYLP